MTKNVHAEKYKFLCRKHIKKDLKKFVGCRENCIFVLEINRKKVK